MDRICGLKGTKSCKPRLLKGPLPPPRWTAGQVWRSLQRCFPAFATPGFSSSTPRTTTIWSASSSATRTTRTSMHSHRQWQGRARCVRIKVPTYNFCLNLKEHWIDQEKSGLLEADKGPVWDWASIYGAAGEKVQLAVHVISIFSPSSFVSLIESELNPHSRGAFVCFNWICAASDLRSWQQKQQVSGGPDKNLVATSESRLEGDSIPWENSTLFSK